MILECLDVNMIKKEIDFSIKKFALELVFLITDESNIENICDILLKKLENSE
jgi:hypothetical protein